MAWLGFVNFSVRKDCSFLSRLEFLDAVHMKSLVVNLTWTSVC